MNTHVSRMKMFNLSNNLVTYYLMQLNLPHHILPRHALCFSAELTRLGFLSVLHALVIRQLGALSLCQNKSATLIVLNVKIGLFHKTYLTNPPVLITDLIEQIWIKAKFCSRIYRSGQPVLTKGKRCEKTPVKKKKIRNRLRIEKEKEYAEKRNYIILHNFCSCHFTNRIIEFSRAQWKVDCSFNKFKYFTIRSCHCEHVSTSTLLKFKRLFDQLLSCAFINYVSNYRSDSFQ